MRLAIITGAVLALGPLAVQAQDAEAGGALFERQCVSCHIIQDEDGETLAGRNARTGPNLYGIVGRQAGSIEGFRYGASIVEAGEAGLVWDAENLVVYLQDPNTFLRDTLDDRRARSQMSFQVRSAEDAANIAAFLASFSPAAEEGEEEEASE